MEAVWIACAFILGFVARQLGLPPLVGFLAAGFVLHAVGVHAGELLPRIAHAGVLLLLFGVGLKLRLKSLIRPEVMAGATLHLLITGVVMGAALHWVFAMPLGIAFFAAVALTFSSTVVAVKVLESKRELRAFHGRAAIGILIMQDIIAVAMLGLGGGDALTPWAFAIFALPLLRRPLQRMLEWSGHGELLILYGLLLALGVGGVGFEWVGLSSELGALIMGALLASHRRSSELGDALWGLKEVLLVAFFLQIGMAGLPGWDGLQIAVLLALLLPGKALLFFFILVLFRLRARSSFLAALTLATYSEFGLVVMSLAVTRGWLAPDWLVIFAVAVALSFLIAAPLNRYAHDLYRRLAPYIDRFETVRGHPDDTPLHIGSSTLVVMGMGRVGTGAYDFLTKRRQRVIGLDSDPGKVEVHVKQGRRVLYADAEDPDLWQDLDLRGVRAVLLAMPDCEANVMAAAQLRRAGYAGFVSATAIYPEEIKLISAAGADEVYYYYDEVGVGFAEHVWERVFPPKEGEAHARVAPPL